MGLGVDRSSVCMVGYGRVEQTRTHRQTRRHGSCPVETTPESTPQIGENKMAKHVHKFLRVPAKKTTTWTCTMCSWFVHDGLSHILLTKDAVCWECEDVFRMSDQAMMEDKPRCDSCRGGASPQEIERILREKGII